MTKINQSMVYTIINEQPKYTYDADTLVSTLQIDTITDRIELLQCLHDLINDHKLFESKKLKYATYEQMGYQIGKYVYKTKRYGFIDTNDGNHYYVRRHDDSPWFDQDTVLFKIKDDVNGEASIIAVIEHTINTVVGTIKVMVRKGRKYYIGLLNHYDLHVKLMDIDKWNINQDTYVIFTITNYDPFTVTISSIIGDAHAPFMDYMALATSYGVFPKYPYDGEVEAMKMASMPIMLDRFHTDLTDLMTFTIDGDDAKDFDDALSLIRHDDHYTVVVSIADVAHYVRYGTALDNAAYDRGTSIYLPGMVIPMLPETLSNGACSLNPGQDRYAISVFMDYDLDGHFITSSIQLSMIRSKYRLTYGKTNAFFENIDRPSDPYTTIGDDLLTLLALSKKIHAYRYQQGGIEFDSQEIQVDVDQKGNPVAITIRHDGKAEQLIEDFMIDANVAVATFLLDHNIPGLYRIHEGIDHDRLVQFNDLTSEIYVPLPNDLDLMDSKTVAQYLSACKVSPYYPIINSRLLRTMKKARYSEVCSPHYGLGLAKYCHFTSPIRRYPDLFVHRMLHYFVFHDQTNDPSAYEGMLETATHTSDCEIRAVQIEREAIDLKCCDYMRRYIGVSMKAQVESITNSGLFVTTASNIDVFVPYYLSPTLWSTQYPYVMVKGDWGQTIMLMDEITIRIDSIDDLEHRIIAGIEPKRNNQSTHRHHPKRSKPRKKVNHGTTRRRKS